MKTPILQFSFLVCFMLILSSMQILEQTADEPKLSLDDKSLVKVVKSENEWKKLLSPSQFFVLRQKGTERPFQNAYHDNHQEGHYFCSGCHLPLFSSKTKFESGTGWPSFYAPIDKKNVTEAVDNSHGMVRGEIVCTRCGGHLGHVFEDGPKPTGLRYCMNSTSLIFQKK